MTGSLQTNSREQNIFMPHGWRWFLINLHGKHTCFIAVACMSEQISECVSMWMCTLVCVCECIVSVFPPCIRINSPVYHVRLCLANRFPSRQARWTQMSSPEETFQGKECPCDTYREGHLTGKRGGVGDSWKVGMILTCINLIFKHVESAQNYINLQSCALYLNALQQQHEN